MVKWRGAAVADAATLRVSCHLDELRGGSVVKWRSGRRSANVEDRRGGRAAPTGVKVGGGIGGVGIIAAIVFFLLGGDPSQIISMLFGGGGGQVAQSLPSSQPAPRGATGATGATSAQDDAADFVSVVLADTEDTWKALFSASGSQYREPTLVLFNDEVQSACGHNTAASGPFYCPPDQKLYLDLAFFQQLARMGGAGDFAQAYVIGHEVAHHVQNLTGVMRSIRGYQGRASKPQQNALQVLVELQADCYAGVWAHHAARDRGLLERGDVEEGLRAAAAIGDDTLQRNAGRRVQPESFTHGSSAQRIDWLKRGMQTGDLGQCDTFGDAGLRL